MCQGFVLFLIPFKILVDMLNTSTDMLVMNQSEDYRQIQENRYQIDQIVCHNCRNFVIKKKLLSVHLRNLLFLIFLQFGRCD